jgi:hypothetical protein
MWLPRPPLHPPPPWLNPIAKGNSRKDGSAGKQNTSLRRSQNTSLQNLQSSGSFENQQGDEHECKRVVNKLLVMIVESYYLKKEP